MGLIRPLRFVLSHPLNRGRPVQALWRFVSWQIGQRLNPGERVLPYVGDTAMAVRRGMTGATGNIYCGLHEFEDMALVLHALGPGDLFVDIGANVGSYALLGATTGADVVTVEPIPATFAALERNIGLTDFKGKVEALNIGLGGADGQLRFTSGHDTVNHVLAPEEADPNAVEVPVRRLDDVLAGRSPKLMKIDVEGFETEVLAGAGATLDDPGLIGLVIELNGSGARYGFDDDALHENLLERGFATYSYEPFGRTLSPLNGGRSSWGNTLYLRDVDEIVRRVKAAPRYKLGNGAEI